MVVGICTLSLFLPHSHSLKDKRRVLKGLKDRLRRFNVSVAEVDGQDLWQRATIGIATVSHDRSRVEEILRTVHDEIEARIPGEIIDYQIDYA